MDVFNKNGHSEVPFMDDIVVLNDTGEDINSRPLAHGDQKIGWARKNELLGAQAATRNRSFLFW